jgi:hypothetical protein
MKKFLSVPALLFVLILSGCFEVTQETNINDNGSGMIVSATDLSSLLAMAKMMEGDNKELKELDKMKMDTIIPLKEMKDSLSNLTDDEKRLLEKATLKIILNAADEKMSLTFSFPYDQPADIPAINSVLKKTKSESISKQLSKLLPSDGSSDMSAAGNGEAESDIEDYYNSTWENGRISRKLNKEKYTTLEADKSLKTLQEMGQMGSPVKFNTIFNLPRPAQKAEGKGLKLSDDKMKVTIEGTIDDLFENPSKFEFEIEY